LFFSSPKKRTGRRALKIRFFLPGRDALLPAERAILFRAAINNRHLRTQSFGDPGAIHRHIAAADHHDFFADINRRIRLGKR